MAAAQIISRVTLNRTWLSTDLDAYNNCYLIAVKGVKLADDTIDPADVRTITFEIGIDSGLTSPIRPIVIGRVTLNFNDESSSDPEVNKITAFKQILNAPNEIYIRAVSINCGEDDITTGKTNISINMNALTLGDA